MTPDKPIGDQPEHLDAPHPVDEGSAPLKSSPDVLPSERELCINNVVWQIVRGLDEPRFAPPEEPLTPDEIDDVIERGPKALNMRRIKVLMADPAALALIRKTVLNTLPEAWIDHIAEHIEPKGKSITRTP